jgi:hypothetical protein
MLDGSDDGQDGEGEGEEKATARLSLPSGSELWPGGEEQLESGSDAGGSDKV